MTIQTIIKSIDHPQTGALSLGVVFSDPQDPTFKEQYRDVPVFLSGAKTPDEAEALVKAALRAERAKLQTFSGVEPKLPIGVPYDIGNDPAPPVVIPPDPALLSYRAAYSFYKAAQQQNKDGISLVTDQIVSDALADLNKKFSEAFIGK